jgi:hypothetical protein
VHQNRQYADPSQSIRRIIYLGFFASILIEKLIFIQVNVSIEDLVRLGLGRTANATREK